ncbi:MAG TPA: hypothetical protein VK763_20805 [Terriglobales bacterium]|nr:hypothetical protein [Terriglobales bacterium]
MKHSVKSYFANPSLRTLVRAITLCLLLAAAFSAETALAQTGYTGIFGGGPFYKNATNNITEIENSGFSEAIVWSVEVNSTGDLNFNGEFPLTSNGVYVGNQTYPDFPAEMAQLKQGTVKRVTFSVGSSNYGDWEDITALIQAQGTGPTSILYKDFQALKAAIPALDAIDFDDENSYNSPTTIAFGVMLGNLGYHVMPDPYTNNSYWINVVSQINTQLPGTVDGVHLQAYAGGQGNSPCVDWNFGSVPVFPGLWDKNDTPSQVESIMSGWHSQCGIIGGFMWIYDDFVGTGLAAQYAAAINTAVGASGFTLTGPSGLFLNQSGKTGALITITPQNGFNGQVTLSLSQLPKGVKGGFKGQGDTRKMGFEADPTATTGLFPVTVTGTSGSIIQTLTFTLAVSAAVAETGAGMQVDLSSDFDVYGIYQDGSKYTTGGIDGLGNSYSANLLTGSRVLDGVLFDFGPANEPDVVASSGQTITLPQGQFSDLVLLATGVNGNQLSQTLVVHYTDGTSSQVVQSFSDWYTPQNFTREYEGVAMQYRNLDDGTKDKRTFSLYAYLFPLNRNKIVQSFTLPDNLDVVILAATLLPAKGAN